MGLFVHSGELGLTEEGSIGNRVGDLVGDSVGNFVGGLLGE